MQQFITGLKVLAVALLAAAGATQLHFGAIVRRDSITIGIGVFVLVLALLLYQIWFWRKQ